MNVQYTYDQAGQPITVMVDNYGQQTIMPGHVQPQQPQYVPPMKKQPLYDPYASAGGYAYNDDNFASAGGYAYNDDHFTYNDDNFAVTPDHGRGNPQIVQRQPHVPEDIPQTTQSESVCDVYKLKENINTENDKPLAFGTMERGECKSEYLSIEAFIATARSELGFSDEDNLVFSSALIVAGNMKYLEASVIISTLESFVRTGRLSDSLPVSVKRFISRLLRRKVLYNGIDSDPRTSKHISDIWSMIVEKVTEDPVGNQRLQAVAKSIGRDISFMKNNHKSFVADEDNKEIIPMPNDQVSCRYMMPVTAVATKYLPIQDSVSMIDEYGWKIVNVHNDPMLFATLQSMANTIASNERFLIVTLDGEYECRIENDVNEGELILIRARDNYI